MKPADDCAAKFINALIKSVQTLCHGYLDFNDGIKIIGHLNLCVDDGTSLDYILKEKVCKNAENSTLFISNSFHAEPKPEQEVPGKDSRNQRTTEDSEESGRLGSAISSISSALSSSHDRQRRSGTKDSNHTHSNQNLGKRKASDDGDIRPSKVSSHHESSSASQSPYHSQSSPVDSKEALRSRLRPSTDHDMGESETMLPQTAGVSSDSTVDIGVNLAGSVLEPVDQGSGDRDDDSDNDLEVTFIKEEFVEGERSACEYENSSQQYGGLHSRASEGMVDPSMYPGAHHSSSASATYVPGALDFPSTSQSQPGSSGMRGQLPPFQLQFPHMQPVSDASLYRGTAPVPQMIVRNHGVETGRKKEGQVHLKKERIEKLASDSQGRALLICNICDKSFLTKVGLKMHTETVHFKQYRFICGQCGKGFSENQRFMDHTNMHNNVKSHQCPKCGKHFTFKTKLNLHLRSTNCV